MAEKEVIEVEVERFEHGAGPPAGLRGRFLSRLWRALGPVLLGMLVDCGDLATLGPLALVAFPAGMVAGYLFSGFLDVSPTWRVGITVLTGLYWASPLNFVPLATVFATAVQVFRPGALAREPF